MGFRLRNPFRKQLPHVNDDVAGQFGFGAPLAILYKHRPLPPTDNAAQFAYQTYLSPAWSPIGGGVPNKRDIGTGKPSYAVQGVLVQPVTGPGILAGSFVSGPLTNLDAQQSSIPMPSTMDSFALPAI